MPGRLCILGCGHYFYRLLHMVLRLFYTLLITLSCFLSEAQVQVALFAGPQATSAHYVVGENTQPSSYKFGGMAGVGLKVPFDNQIYFFPTAYYSLKGYKVTLNDPSFPPTQFAKNNNTTIQTLEIAPMLQVDFSKKPAYWFVRFGPAVDFAFYGKEVFDTVSRTGTKARVSRSMVFSFGDYGRISASANLHLGYQARQGLMVFAFYNLGIGSMNNADNGPRILHRIGGLAVGWLLGKKQ